MTAADRLRRFANNTETPLPPAELRTCDEDAYETQFKEAMWTTNHGDDLAMLLADCLDTLAYCHDDWRDRAGITSPCNLLAEAEQLVGGEK